MLEELRELGALQVLTEEMEMPTLCGERVQLLWEEAVGRLREAQRKRERRGGGRGRPDPHSCSTDNTVQQAVTQQLADQERGGKGVGETGPE